MNKALSRVGGTGWANGVAGGTPLSATNLNTDESALDIIDDRVVLFDTTKANQVDLLTCLSNVTYDTTTGEFVFTWKNGTTYTVDLNVEKIPVSFSMSSEGVITMTATDGTVYTADISSLIKLYAFEDSDEIDFTVETDEHGDKTITATIKEGSVTEEMLETNFLANCRLAVAQAESSASSANTDALKAEGMAVGKQNGADVDASSIYYHNNAKYYSEVAEQIAGGGVLSFNGRSGQVVPQSGDYSKADVGLGNVDNTSDLAKPISTATQTALDAKTDTPTNVSGSGAITVTLADNTEYSYTSVSSLNMTGAAVSAHGFISFGSSPTVSLSGFTKSSGDDITEATSSEVWEFCTMPFGGGAYVIWKRWD